MDVQVRLYEIESEPGALESFEREWRERVVPLRERLGFVVLGGWPVVETNQFVWLLGYAGPDGIDAANARYYASGERAALRPDPARHIAAVHEWNVRVQ